MDKVDGVDVGVDVARSHELYVPSVNVLADVDDTGAGVYGGYGSGLDVDEANEVNVPSVNVNEVVSTEGTS